MDSFEAEQARRKIEADFETMGRDLGMDARCIASESSTGVVFEDANGHHHLFNFAPTLGDDESFSIRQ